MAELPDLSTPPLATSTPTALLLRIYDPAECDSSGIPLDWERCRACEGTGGRPECRDWACAVCDGNGSLKAAALAGRWSRVIDVENPGSPEPRPIRCEDCGHPMSDGTWTEPLDDNWDPISVVDSYLREDDPDTAEKVIPVHYSPCDEGCRHGGHLRMRNRDTQAEREGSWAEVVEAHPSDPPIEVQAHVRFFDVVEASWRPVDVRTLGWAHDLHPEKLAVLCLRCWAARKDFAHA